MKYLMLAAAFGMVATGAMANTTKNGKSGWRQNLTPEQRTCFEQHGCPRFTKEERGMKSEKELDAMRACKRAAFAACGIERPERNRNGGKARTAKK